MAVPLGLGHAVTDDVIAHSGKIMPSLLTQPPNIVYNTRSGMNQAGDRH
jgi:hypothetical protein